LLAAIACLQSFAEYFLGSVPIRMIAFSYNERVSAPARHSMHDRLRPP